MMTEQKFYSAQQQANARQAYKQQAERWKEKYAKKDLFQQEEYSIFDFAIQLHRKMGYDYGFWALANECDAADRYLRDMERTYHLNMKERTTFPLWFHIQMVKALTLI